MVRMMHAIDRDYQMAERSSGDPGCSASGGTMTPLLLDLGYGAQGW
jgi:hypothetical protein